MTATDQMRAMLNELMGTSGGGEQRHLDFDDPRVCKSFLLGCCPHEILTGTRMDIGDCAKVHDLALKADYSNHPKKERFFFEYDALKHLENFIGDCDRKADQARRKLKETQEELSEEAAAKADEVHRLGELIGTKLAAAEQLGQDAQVEESLKLMSEVDELNKEKGRAEMEFRSCMPMSSYQQQKLRVCDVCSAYLGVHDNDRRLADHFGGKLHLGFINIRNRLDELRLFVAQRKLEKDKEEVREPKESVSRKRSRSRERRRDREGRSSSHRSRESGRRRSRSRSRESRHRRRHHRSRGGDSPHSRSSNPPPAVPAPPPPPAPILDETE